MSKFPAYFLGIHNLLVGRTKEMDEQVLAAVNSAGMTQLVAESGKGRPSGAACAKSSSTTGGIQKVEQTAPLRDGPAAWA